MIEKQKKGEKTQKGKERSFGVWEGQKREERLIKALTTEFRTAKRVGRTREPYQIREKSQIKRKKEIQTKTD